MNKILGRMKWSFLFLNGRKGSESQVYKTYLKRISWIAWPNVNHLNKINEKYRLCQNVRTVVWMDCVSLTSYLQTSFPPYYLSYLFVTPFCRVGDPGNLCLWTYRGKIGWLYSYIEKRKVTCELYTVGLSDSVPLRSTRLTSDCGCRLDYGWRWK